MKLLLVCLLGVVAFASAWEWAYEVQVLSVEPKPVVSFIGGSSAFGQVFNPSYVPPVKVAGGVQGLLLRTQNCTAQVGGDCVFCGGADQHASVITFAKLVQGGTATEPPVFAFVDNSSIVYDHVISGLGDQTLYGTEDPRLAYDASTGIFYLFYTCYGPNTVLLCEAYSTDPTRQDKWTTVGPVFPSYAGSKSAALLIRDSAPHYLLWGDHDIRIAQSSNLTSWPDEGKIILSPRSDHFDDGLVESGPPPLKLSTGDYLFFYNSANAGWPKSGGYHPAWAVLDKNDPTNVLQRAENPLLSPDQLWEQGVNPWTCNAPNVVFLEAATPTEQQDVFRVYFGGSDAVVGSAVIAVTKSVKNNRPPPEKRLFVSPIVDAVIANISSKMVDTDLAVLFTNCLPNTLDTTVYYTPAGSPFNKPDTFVLTGDIPAMWQRDSTNQVMPYLRYVLEEPRLQDMFRGLINRQAANVLKDPYANAYNRDLSIWERKYELDSLANVVRLATQYYQKTKDISPFDDEWLLAMQLVIDTITVQQAGSDEPDPYGGKEGPTKRCGLSKSPFRPSDDATIFAFLIPSNAMSVVVLRDLAVMCRDLRLANASAVADAAQHLADEIDTAIGAHAIEAHPELGRMYAYEVDGFGSTNFMDDANVPSLLALPYMGYTKVDDPLYQATRHMLLSTWNPWYFEGNATLGIGSGIGGPHIGEGWIWPMSITMQALTSTDDAEIRHCLAVLKASSAGTGFMHESYWKDDYSKFTRPWFAWANSLFGELILRIAEEKPYLIF